MKLKWFLLLLFVLILVWIVNSSRPGIQIESCLEDCSTTVPGVGKPLRVVSLNMLHGFPKFNDLSKRLEIISDEILRLDAHIVLLQEVPWTLKTGNAAKLLSNLTGMNYIYQRANGNRWAIGFEEGEAILSRYPLKSPDHYELQPQAGFFEHRIVLNATAITEFGDIGLYVTHLTNGDPDINFGQSKSLVDVVWKNVGTFSIIAGDFNAEPETDQIHKLGLTWIDAYNYINPLAEGYTCCVNNLNSSHAIPSKRIDYIFLAPGSTDLNVVSADRVFSHPFQIESGWLWASDHIGLSVEIANDL
jgi:endonuclease/exonuclease/phosphatase family metal-dependent hydrolase